MRKGQKKNSKCQDCDSDIKETVMIEDGFEYPIWVCSNNSSHWGER